LAKVGVKAKKLRSVYLEKVQNFEGYQLKSLDLVELALLINFQLLKLLVVLQMVLGKVLGCNGVAWPQNDGLHC
jgi:hypothetical protein